MKLKACILDHVTVSIHVEHSDGLALYAARSTLAQHSLIIVLNFTSGMSRSRTNIRHSALLVAQSRVILAVEGNGRSAAQSTSHPDDCSSHIC